MKIVTLSPAWASLVPGGISMNLSIQCIYTNNKLDQHLLGHLYGNVVKIIIILMT